MSAETGARLIRNTVAAAASSALLLLSSCSTLVQERRGIPTPVAPMNPVVDGRDGRMPLPVPTQIATQIAAPIATLPVIATPLPAPTAEPIVPPPLPEGGVIVDGRIPPPRLPPPACGKRDVHVVHVVRAQETLYSIAVRHHTTVAEIMRLNRIRDPRAVAVGRRLVLVTCTSHPPAEKRPGHSSHRYVVQAGDNLFRIGQRFGVSAASIRAANGLRSNAIRVGQVLVIP